MPAFRGSTTLEEKRRRLHYAGLHLRTGVEQIWFEVLFAASGGAISSAEYEHALRNTTKLYKPIDAVSPHYVKFAQFVQIIGALDSREHPPTVIYKNSVAIVAGETEAYRSALNELEPLSEMVEMGCFFEVSFPDCRTAVVDLQVESEKVVPREARTLTRTGKLSIKAVPQGKFFELYQNYVCGCVLRTAREFFSFLPVERVVVNVKATLLDSATGHLREQTILSVGMPRATCDQMNFASVDPSDAMALFPHRMGFTRSQGFFAVPLLKPAEFPS